MKVALVTGGSRGIGKAICIQLAKDENYHVLINYNGNKKEALDTLKKIKNVGGSGKIMQFDVTDHNEVQEKLNAWQENNKDSIIEVIVNNAGITKDKLFTWMKQDEWNDVLQSFLDDPQASANHIVMGMNLDQRKKAKGKNTGKPLPTWI